MYLAYLHPPITVYGKPTVRINCGCSVNTRIYNLFVSGRLSLAEIAFLYRSLKMYHYRHFHVFTLTYSFPGTYIRTLS